MTTLEMFLLAMCLYNFLVLRLRVRRLEQLEACEPSFPGWLRNL